MASAGNPQTGEPEGERWTETRRNIYRLLLDRDQDSAHLYRVAVASVGAPLSRADLMISGHCVRELIKVLPTLLGYPMLERADASRAARELHKYWVAHRLPLGADAASSDTEAVAIPREVFVAAREVANAGAAGSKNSRELTAVIVAGLVTETDAASVKRVHQAIEMFRRWAHARDYSKPAGSLPSIEQVLRELEIIEEALMNRLGNMADRAVSVRELLARANRKTDEVAE
jgi:hypothetical protein